MFRVSMANFVLQHTRNFYGLVCLLSVRSEFRMNTRGSVGAFVSDGLIADGLKSCAGIIWNIVYCMAMLQNVAVIRGITDGRLLICVTWGRTRWSHYRNERKYTYTHSHSYNVLVTLHACHFNVLRLGQSIATLEWPRPFQSIHITISLYRFKKMCVHI